MLLSIFSELPWTAMLQQNVQNLLMGGILWLPVHALTAGDPMLLSRFSTTRGRPRERGFHSLAVYIQPWELTLTMMIGTPVYFLITFSLFPQLTETQSYPTGSRGNISIITASQDIELVRISPNLGTSSSPPCMSTGHRTPHPPHLIHL